MLPFLEEIKNLNLALLPLKDALKTLKKDKASYEKIAAVEDAIKTNEKATREAQSRVTDIDAAVFDLKAVNPYVKAIVDTRSVLDVIDNINQQGQIVATAMNNLRSLLAVSQ